MLYESTRGQYRRVLSAEAIKQGLSPDGGLFVPMQTPVFSEDTLKNMPGLSYQDIAVMILKELLSDYTEEELVECVNLAYNQEKFDNPEIAPLRKLDSSLYILELWHGPTCAFKDMALQILPHLLTRAMSKTGEESTLVILVATSGDTGKAALEGFRDVPGTRVIVFYPEEGVSQVQKLQMVTQEGGNVNVVAVRGNFDDAQSGVKQIFGNAEFNLELVRGNYKLSSANSINWGRLAPQIVYYFTAYLDLVDKGEITFGEKINFVVPTGNFGNILAAWYAQEMGLPVKKLICAANSNNVLTDFIRTGTYNRDREFKKTISPSMDILISSNLERMLYLLSGRNHTMVRNWMDELGKAGIYQVDDVTRARIGKILWSDYADDNATMDTIRSIYTHYSYVVDTHTAVGINVYQKYVNVTGDNARTVIASTASPFKFNESVARAILGEDVIRGKNEFDLLEVLNAISNMEIPSGLKSLETKAILHDQSSSKLEMLNIVRNILL